MTDTLLATVKSTIAWDRIETTAVGTRRDKKSLSNTQQLEDGSLTGQADRVFHDVRAIPANGVDALDLMSLTKQMFSTTVPMDFSVVRVIRVLNRAEAPGQYINLGADETSPMTVFAVRVGSLSECVLSSWQEGWPVLEANKTLRLSNPGSSPVEYEIVIIGA